MGDDDQVIYSFRGANSYNIQAFEDRYSGNTDYKQVALEKNYRSSQPILDLANASIGHNVDRMEKILVSALDREPLKPIRFWGEKEDQLQFLIREINHIVKHGHGFNDIAVLCRTHGQCGIVIQALNRTGIPVLPRRMGLFHISAVRDIIAWCQLIASGSFQDSALYRIIEKESDYETVHLIYASFNNLSLIHI